MRSMSLLKVMKLTQSLFLLVTLLISIVYKEYDISLASRTVCSYVFCLYVLSDNKTELRTRLSDYAVKIRSIHESTIRVAHRCHSLTK